MKSNLYISWFNLSINMELEYFASYSNHMETFILDEMNRIEKLYNMDIENYDLQSSEEKEFLFEMKYGDDYLTFRDTFPSILRTSLFNSMYSFLESELNKICRSLERSFTTKVNEFKYDKGIERSKKYMKQICKIDFPSGTKEWQYILHYREIRNFLIHEGTDLLIEKGTNPRLENALKNIPGITLRDTRLFYEATFEEEYCEKFLKILYSFFDKLKEALTVFSENEV